MRSECLALNCDQCRLQGDYGCVYCEGDALCIGRGRICPFGNDPKGLLVWACDLPSDTKASTTMTTTTTTIPLSTTTTVPTPTSPACARTSIVAGKLYYYFCLVFFWSLIAFVKGDGLFRLGNASDIVGTWNERVFEIGVRDADGNWTSAAGLVPFLAVRVGSTLIVANTSVLFRVVGITSEGYTIVSGAHFSIKIPLFFF